MDFDFILKYLHKYQAQLIAVSKTKPIEAIMELYNKGQRDFGENKVQELVGKYEVLPKDIRWHLIGHLQSNKVKYIVPFVYLIHSVDSFELLQEINKQAIKYDSVVKCLLQVKIAQEDTKTGFSEVELIDLSQNNSFAQLSNIEVCGLMGMATFTDDEEVIASEFQFLKALFDFLKENYFKNNNNFKEISMGMSDDFKIALTEGATMIRIGSLLFGNRN